MLVWFWFLFPFFTFFWLCVLASLKKGSCLGRASQAMCAEEWRGVCVRVVALGELPAGTWGRDSRTLPAVTPDLCQPRLHLIFSDPFWWWERRKGWKQTLVFVGYFKIRYQFPFLCFHKEDGVRIEYLLPSSASAFSVFVPKHENSCDNVTILLMVHALVDTLHCPKICNHLIVIAILLYCHYGTSGGESYEHVISAERDNLLNLAKCHHFSKMKQNYFIMHVLL